MNKRGIMRIVEASVAALIVMGFLFINFNQTRTDTGIDLSEKANEILEEIAKNLTLREAVLNQDEQAIEDFVSTRISESFNFEARICDVASVCGKSTFTEGNVYSRERVISSTIDSAEFKPKKVKIFIWQ